MSVSLRSPLRKRWWYIPRIYSIMGKSKVFYDWKFPKVRRLIFVGTFHLIGESNGWCVQYPGSSFLGSKQVQYFSFTVSCSRVRGFLKTEMFFPTSTLSVFEKFPPVHAKMLKQWEYDSRTGAVWRMAPSYSKTSVFVRPHEEIKVAFWRDFHYPLSCPLAP